MKNTNFIAFSNAKMMVPIRGEILVSCPRVGSPSYVGWLYLVAEFFIGAAITGSLALLGILKSFLPKPPRDLTGDVVLVTGVTSTLGTFIADEFARNGCTIICVDEKNDEKLKEIENDLTSRYPSIIEIGPKDRRNKDEATENSKIRARSLVCDIWDRKAIRDLARKVDNDVGPIDVLVTCAGHSGQDILDTVNVTLMSHYWTVLAFLPLMLRQKKAHIIGVTPTSSTEDAYAGTRAAISGLMESLGQEFGSQSSNLNFLTVAPKADPRLLHQSEQQVARDVVEAVRRDQCTLNASCFSTMLYRISCAIHTGISTITHWLYSQSCDYPH